MWLTDWLPEAFTFEHDVSGDGLETRASPSNKGTVMVSPLLRDQDMPVQGGGRAAHQLWVTGYIYWWCLCTLSSSDSFSVRSVPRVVKGSARRHGPPVSSQRGRQECILTRVWC